MTETSTTSNTQPVPDHVAIDVVIEVLSQALDDMDEITVDIGHITGDEEPAVGLSLTANWGSPDNVLLTLWHEDNDDATGPTELGTFAVTIRRVI